MHDTQITNWGRFCFQKIFGSVRDAFLSQWGVGGNAIGI